MRSYTFFLTFGLCVLCWQYSVADRSFHKPGPSDILSDCFRSSNNVTAQKNLTAVSDSCRLYLTEFLGALLEEKTWAIQMVDAFGKIPSNVLRGRLQWLGSYHECMNVVNSSTNYCLTKLGSSDDLVAIQHSPALATCLPKECGADDIRMIVDDLLDCVRKEAPFKITALDGVSARSPVCRFDQPFEWGFYLLIALVAVFAVLSVLGTFIDCHRKPVVTKRRLFHRLSLDIDEDEPLLERIESEETVAETFPAAVGVLLCFSVSGAWRSLTEPRKDEIGFLEGMRVISIWWVVLGEGFNLAKIVYENPLDYLDDASTFFGQLITNASFAADTFFVISGLVLTYTLLKKLENQRVNWFAVYLRRWWRLTPMYVAVLLIFIFVVPHVIVGPFPYLVGQDLGGDPLAFCKKYWWANVLYVNNFIPSNINELCMDWTWFLAVEMQLFVVTPIMVYVLYRWPMVGITLPSLAIIGSIGANAGLSAHWGLAITITDQPLNNMTYDINADYVMTKPYTRASPYFLGMLLGFIFARKAVLEIPTQRQKAFIAATGWIVSTITAMFAVFGLTVKAYDSPTGSNFNERVTYQTLSRFAYSLAVCWVLFACQYGLGKPVRALLEWKVWRPLGRLTFMVYLLHPLALQLYLINQQDPFYYDFMNMIGLYFGQMVTSYLLAFVLALCFEIPLLRLEKEVLSPKTD